MNDDSILIGVAAAALAAVGAYFHELILPLTMLGIVMVCDYCSGMIRAWEHHNLNSKVGALGIVKKLAYMFAVAVAVTIDWVVQIAAVQAGFDNAEGTYFCALLVTIWLILNECISILENIRDIGVPIPSFLMAMVKRLKTKTEQSGNGESGEMINAATENLQITQNIPYKPDD